MHIYWKLSFIIHTRNMVCCHMKPCCRPYRTCWTSGWGCPPSCRRRKGRREPALWTWLKSNWRIFRLLPWIRSSSCQYLSQNFCQNWMFLLNITTSFHPLKNLWEFGSNSTDFDSKFEWWFRVEIGVIWLTHFTDFDKSVRIWLKFHRFWVVISGGEWCYESNSEFSPIFPSELANCSASLLTRSSGLKTTNKMRHIWIKSNQQIDGLRIIRNFTWWTVLPRREGNMENLNKVPLLHLTSWILIADFWEVTFCHLHTYRRTLHCCWPKGFYPPRVGYRRKVVLVNVERKGGSRCL